MTHEIRTERLLLRPARPEDLDAFHRLVSDFAVVRQTASWPWPPDRAFTASRCQPVPPGDGMVGLVFLPGKTGPELIGSMGAFRGGLGYMFARAHWGRGYATEIGRALIAHVWAHYPWDEITATVLEGNPASVRVLEKLGFVAAGATTCPSIARGPGHFPARTFRLARP